MTSYAPPPGDCWRLSAVRSPSARETASSPERGRPELQEKEPVMAPVVPHQVCVGSSWPPYGDEFKIVRSERHGIMPHSIILLMTGAATMLTNEARILGSLRNIVMASCSCCDGGFFWAFVCHSCSQLDV